MSSLTRRILSVLAVVAVTTVSIYALVDLVTVADAGQTAAAQAAAANSVPGGTQTCPATGCTANSCHATDPTAPGPGTARGSQNGGGYGQTDPSLQPGAGSGSDGRSGTVMTCPATGCQQTYCHATGQGTPQGGSRRHRGQYYDNSGSSITPGAGYPQGGPDSSALGAGSI